MQQEDNSLSRLTERLSLELPKYIFSYLALKEKKNLGLRSAVKMLQPSSIRPLIYLNPNL